MILVKENIEAFLNNQQVVCLNDDEEIKEFLDECTALGLHWLFEAPANEYLPEHQNKGIQFFCRDGKHITCQTAWRENKHVFEFLDEDE